MAISSPFNWGKAGLKRVRQKQKVQEKASSVGSMVAYNNLGQPVWTPRNYEALTAQGFRKNVICLSLCEFDREGRSQCAMAPLSGGR